MIILSTKEKIKKIARKLFSKKGYYGASMNDIADSVGVTKASLYSHWPGKAELFVAVADDFIQDYKILFDKLLDSSKDMAISEKLHYIFNEYIYYYLKYPANFYFASKNIFPIRWTPMSEKMFDKIINRYKSLDDSYRHKLEAIFSEGMKQGIISQGDPIKRTWWFKSNMNGTLSLMFMEQLGANNIEEFWNDFWFGIAEKSVE